MFRERNKDKLLKTKRWEELSSGSFMQSCLFGLTLQLQSSFRCLSLWCSSASVAVLCFLFYPRMEKSAVLFLDLFSEACLNKLMTSATQTICIWRVLFQNEIFTFWNKESQHGQNDWQLRLESRITCWHFYLLDFSYSNSTGCLGVWMNGCIAFWN